MKSPQSKKPSSLKRKIKMTEDNRGKKRNELKELQSIRNLLILQLLKSGASSEEINLATGMGASNVREMFPNVRKPAGLEKKVRS